MGNLAPPGDREESASHYVPKVVRYFNGSRQDRATGLILSERAPKTMGIDVEFNLFHGFYVDISRGRGGPGTRSGGWGPGHSGAPPGPGGECFAPSSHACIVFLSEASSSSHVIFQHCASARTPGL